LKFKLLSGGQATLPSIWMSMSNNEYVKRVTLNSGAEYQRVEKLFTGQVRNGLYSRKVKNSGGVQVLKVGLFMIYQASDTTFSSIFEDQGKLILRPTWQCLCWLTFYKFLYMV
jgi:hypothetical protein